MTFRTVHAAFARVRWVAVASSFTLALGACGDSFFFDPAPSGPGALALRWAAALGGPADAFDQADNVRVRLTAPGGGAVLMDEEIPFQDGGSVTLQVELEDDEATFALQVEVRLGSDVLFRADDQVVLRPGETTTATLVLEPVAAGLAIPPDPPTLTAYGDTLLLGGAAVFATGDTIPDRVPSWSTEDPEVVNVVRRSDGSWIAVALADGTAQMTASLDGLQQNGSVEVRAEVQSVAVVPPEATIAVDEELQLQAVPRDRRGNDIPDRSATWSSNAPATASVDPDDGRVRGESAGSATVDADVEGAVGSAAITVLPRTPEVTTLTATGVGGGEARLRGSVNPRGLATDALFEWGTDPALANPLETSSVAVGSGQTAIAIDAVLSQLPPATTFYFRAVAASSAGEARGGIQSFRTPDPPTAPSNLTLVIDGGVIVRWSDNSTDESTFEVERSVQPPSFGSGTAQQAGFERIAVVGPGAEEYFDEEPPTGLLTYRVRACSSDGCSDYTPPASISFAAPPVVATQPPSQVNPTSARLVGTVDPMGSPTQAWFEVDDNPGLLSPFSTPAANVGSAPGSVTFDRLVGGLAEGSTYYYRAVASNDGGLRVGAVASFTTPVTPGTPQNVDADFGESGFDVFWDDVSSNESYFEIQREEDGTGFVTIATVPANTTFYNDLYSGPASVLRWRVRACTQTVCSPYSDPAVLGIGQDGVPE